MKSVPTKQVETWEDVAIEQKKTIESISKKDLFEERFGKIQFLMTLYKYYELWTQLNSIRGFLQTLWSLLNGSLLIVSLIYLSQEENDFIDALIILTVLNPAMQMISFAVFQHRQFKTFSILNQIINTILFGTFNFLKIWDIVMISLYLCVKRFTQNVKRDFSSDGYLKFKSYAAKFVGSISITVFKWDSVSLQGSIFEIMRQPFYQAVTWRTSVEEALNKLPQFFIYILALSEGSSVDPLWVISFMQQLKEGLSAIKDILEVVIKDFLIPALILSKISVEQFYQSMLYLSSVSNQILLEYPKSFQIVSKVNEDCLKEIYTFKIDVKNLDYSIYDGKKKEKMLAQFKYVLASLKKVLEIEQAQRLFCMGPEIHDFIRCLKVCEIYQLKLNFYLDEVQPQNLPHINAFIQHCPETLQFIQIQVETTDLISMEFCLGRQATLTAFSYSYFQIMQQYQNNAQTVQQQYLRINKQFLELDRYDFEQFYFEVAGNLDLNECDKFFENFTNMKIFKLSLNNHNQSIQTFNFQNCLKSNMEILDITFENINLDFSVQPLENLKIFKLVMNKCEFNKEDLQKILQNFTSQKQVVYIDMIHCENRFTVNEQKELLKLLELQKIDVTIKI